ncbi:uncharacterized protein LOC119689358 [Teleopsis dalmanni]|uniref:uncharacterized protein LOC119689358 n=1 Tax=Teleopsis dalmanni TaxID=139649 RepID=UPI0018CDE216|nr:uncharacterized protein LOC119689358 [Teleopsis dalmanni]
MYRTESGRFQVKDPLNPTFEEKLHMLSGCLRRRKSCEFKLIAFIAAARSDDYLIDLKPFPPGFITPTGENDIEGLRQLILEIPNTYDILKCILRKQVDSLNPKMVELIFWIQINIPHMIDEPVEKFLDNCHISYEDFPSEKKPLAVFAIGGRVKDRFREYCVENNIKPACVYFYCHIHEVFRILVNDFLEEQSPSIILRKTCDPEQLYCEAVWEKSECFSEIRCIAMCSLLPSSSHVQSSNDVQGECIEIVDMENIFIERFILYPDDWNESNAETTSSRLREFGYILAFTSITCLAVSALIRKIGSNPIAHRLVSKCLGTLQGMFKISVNKAIDRARFDV